MNEELPPPRPPKHSIDLSPPPPRRVKKTVEQLDLMSVNNAWQEHWQGMPEFSQQDLKGEKSLTIHVRTLNDLSALSEALGQKITPDTRSAWFPKENKQVLKDKRYVDESEDKKKVNKYPIYVISKGRWDTRLTSRTLEHMHVPYRIVIEPQELEQYSSVIDPDKILVLPFSNLGQGSIPARNWVWEHSISEGYARHWILDDNIRWFYRLNNNCKIRCDTGAIFAAAEDFTDRYENVGLSGLNYSFLGGDQKVGNVPAFYQNTRIYSCILIRNDLQHRWRGRYNEDTDLSLRVLKDGMPTVLFQAFLCGKQATMTMKGGNTESLYKLQNEDGRLLMAQSLQAQHPDVCRITQKWGRWQHHVDYRPFEKNKLIFRSDYLRGIGNDEFGMKLIYKKK